MAENLDVVNTAVSLFIRAALLAARFSGRVRQRYLKRLAARNIDAKAREILFLKDRVYLCLSSGGGTAEKRRGSPQTLPRKRCFVRPELGGHQCVSRG